MLAFLMKKIYAEAEIKCLNRDQYTFQDKSIMAEIERSGLERIAEVEDPIVRGQLTPNHPFGCKRPLFSDKFYPIFNRKNVELICDPIKSVTDNGIETEKSEET